MQETNRDDTRSRIIVAALKLLRRYGEDKLTVVDIAKSLGMSHANVYRFFRNKTDILDAVVDEWLAKVEEFLEQIATGPGTAAERLQAVVVHLHLKRRQKFLEDTEVYESFRRLFELRPDAAPRHRLAILGVFRRLIAEGVASGE
ncbi:MAG TPA: TetR/AcrR family transcriptional regulator, partial [Candidatus Limnocylindria bacterium]|nr:TetR/AcrR family transcriptional regulator [Candidatus Limnocylindria bacterium]